MAIIDELREAVNNRGESYRAIARAIEVDHAMLLRFVDGKKMLSLEVAERLAGYLNMRLESSR